MTRRLLDPSKCSFFQPTFDNHECRYYSYATDSNFQVIHGECGTCKKPEMGLCVADITRPASLSHSSSQDFLTCHYLHWLKKYRGIQVKNAHMGNGLKGGKLWDSALQKILGDTSINLKEIIDDYEIDPMLVARVRALTKAYMFLGIEVDPDYQLQAKVDLRYTINLQPNTFIPSVSIGPEPYALWQDRADGMKEINVHVNGFYDRKYENYFVENKLSKSPQYYLDPWYLMSQIGTYFLADPKLEYVIMEVCQMPQQKSIGEFKDEDADSLCERIYKDVLSRPSAYFIGWNKESKRYGKKIFRGEFDLVALEERYKQIVIEIAAARWSGVFYKREKMCDNLFPGTPCDYQSICKTGNMTEQKYYIRK